MDRRRPAICARGLPRGRSAPRALSVALDYDDLAPYYERTERVLAITAGPEAVSNLPLGYANFRARIPPDWGR